ncbi:MAG: DUF748 domain-containing protein [Candidatus Omnitrophica bacterium]|nr:DUF748 domain-containing protein [Candidatus Omnitrophota bacterium]
MINNRKLKNLFLVLLSVAIVLIIALFSSIPFLVRSEYLEQLVTRAVKDQLGYTPSFGQFRISFFPTPALHIVDFELKPAVEAGDIPFIKAEKAVFRPSLFALLLGKSELSHMALNGADIHYTLRSERGEFLKAVSLRDVSLKLWQIRSNHPIRFKLRGKFLSDSENLALSGTFQTNFKGFRPKDFASKIQMSIGPIELSRLLAWSNTASPVQIESGTFSFSGQITKSEGNVDLEFRGTSNIQNLVYQIPPKAHSSKVANYQAKFQAHADLESGAVVVKESTLTAPFGGPFEIEGKFNFFRRVIDELFIKSKGLKLEVLPQYLTSFEETLPVNLGFSGESQLDFFAKGDPALLLTHTRVDFTQTTLTYSQYFSKSSGVPLFFEADMKLAGGRVLRGDFSLEFEPASLKGSVVALDLLTGEGEITLLTNKFTIDHWEPYFPLLREFDLSGGIKVLTSLKGNFNRPEELRLMSNISLDGLQARASNGAEIKNLSGSIDFGPLDSELRDIRFEIGNSQFAVEGKMFKQPDARWLIRVQSPEVNIHDFVSQLHKVDEALALKEEKLDWKKIEDSIHSFVSPEESLNPFDFEVALSEGRMVVPHLRGRVFGGAISSQAVFDYSDKTPGSVIELGLDRLSLAKMQSASQKRVMDGNLFAAATLTSEGPIDSEWLARLKGKGSLSVTNGEFHTLDILGSLGDVAELAPLAGFKSGTTRFNDIRGDIQVGNKKIETENLILLSDDFQIEGAGEVSFEGNLNFRLSIFLAPQLSKRIVPGLGENMRLGPIPVLITGSLTQPSLRKDPMLIGVFLESLVRQQFSKIASRFIPTPRTTSQEPGATQNQSQSTQQALINSGFSLLESFLSQKKSSS